MSKKDSFVAAIQAGYQFSGSSIVLGGAMLDAEAIPGLQIKIPLRSMNRHGLIAGATGTGKTKSLQVIAEQLAHNGVPCLLMDIKGDLSGIAMPGTDNPKITERAGKIGITWHAQGNSVEFLTLSGEKGARLRATVSEFGPVLFSRILGLNDTQGGVVAVVFKYCDDRNLPLLDLKDFKKVLQYLGNEGKAEIEAEFGQFSSATAGTILRKVVELEQQGAEAFFGEVSFDVQDLARMDENGRGVISIVRLTDIQDRPKLFSTFMLQMLAEIYASFPEKGDVEQPELCIFIDEAHLVFQEASAALMQQMEAIIKLIRSKGVGIYFITQNPADIPESVLAQLGMKVQHSLRAFTAKDRKAIKLAAENYPITEYYETEDLLTSLGIGEAIVSVLNEKGIPTPLAHTLMRAPESRMDILTPTEIDGIIGRSALARKYNQEVDRESAYEILNGKIAEAQEMQAEQQQKTVETKREKEEPSMIETIAKDPLARQIGRTVARELTRGLLGVLGLGGASRSTRKKTSWF
ncbi:MAG TPA: helicase HerA-like domain-containing protein [Saprospiraceae bacterium]|nr:helicase HerA-like domain-containing protein [Saprospiraceae bacterium]